MTIKQVKAHPFFTGVEWKHRETIVNIFKQYNWGKGKVSKKQVIQKLNQISNGEYTQAIKNLINYVESV